MKKRYGIAMAPTCISAVLLLAQCVSGADDLRTSLLNEIFGAELIGVDGRAKMDEALMGGMWNQEWSDETDSFYRRYSHGEPVKAGGRVYSRLAHYRGGRLWGLSVVFSNLGDSGNRARGGPSVDAEIRREAGLLEKSLSENLGGGSAHVRKDGGVSESGRLWQTGGLSIFLTHAPGAYVRLSAFPSDRGSPPRVSDTEMRQKNKKNVVRRDNGDVVISGFPMTDQGSKGYCVPASWVRMLQFMGVDSDMYAIAAASGSTNGGTDIFAAAAVGVEAAKGGGRRVSFPSLKPTAREISSYVDRGLPLMWGVSYSDQFRVRGEAASGAVRSRPPREGKLWVGTPHMCVIVGYNAKTREIAVTDSWGRGYEEIWYDEDSAGAASLGKFYAIEY